MNFNIKEDLQDRPLAQQIEILWISGWTWHDAAAIAKILKISKAEVLQAVNGEEIMTDSKKIAARGPRFKNHKGDCNCILCRRQAGRL